MKYSAIGGWVEIGNKRFYSRSKSEVTFARYLDFLQQKGVIKEWLYEPQTFWFLAIKRGVRSYKPDFKIVEFDGSHHWVEVKGYMDAKSSTKLKRFAKYYPEETIRVVDSKWFKENQEKLKGMLDGYPRKRIY